nr:MAG TPA: hypothetical protein [Caudoviricetes sp.]DAZ07936.1 MAG TPA: hypothetical protein [Caudoviricetes sp.]
MPTQIFNFFFFSHLSHLLTLIPSDLIISPCFYV